MLYPGYSIAPVKMTDQDGRTWSVPDATDADRTAIFFMRYLGCPLCKAAVDTLAEATRNFSSRRVALFGVVQSTPREVAGYVARQHIPYRLIADPEKRLYRHFEVTRGGLEAVLSPGVVVAAVRATLQGHRHGRFSGDELQKPAAFVLAKDGVVMHVRYGRTVADFASPEELLSAMA